MKSQKVLISFIITIALICFCIFAAIHNSKKLAQNGSPAVSVKSGTSIAQIVTSGLNHPAGKKPSSTAPSKMVSSSIPLASSPDQKTAANQKTAYLTFDDGPSRLTPHLLDILRQNNVKATFFVIAQGRDTPQKREWLKMESSQGHTIGIHSWLHDYDTIYASEQNFLDDFKKMRNMIMEATGVEPKISRFPGGIGNTKSIKASHGQIIMPALVKDVETMGITPFDWNAGGEDAVSHIPSADKLAQDVLSDCKGHKNVVILLHDSVPHDSSIEAVPKIVQQLRTQGYTFASLIPQSPTVQEHFAKGR